MIYLDFKQSLGLLAKPFQYNSSGLVNKLVFTWVIYNNITKIAAISGRVIPLHKKARIQKKSREYLLFKGDLFGWKRVILLKGLGFSIFITNSSVVVKLGKSHSYKLTYNRERISIRKHSSTKITIFSKDLKEIYLLTKKIKDLIKTNPYTLKGIYINKVKKKKKKSAKALLQ